MYLSIAEYLQTGQTSPNLGQAYTRLRTPAIRFQESDRETFRVTAFGELDLTEKDGWLRHVGKHRFTGLYNDYTLDTHSLEWRDAWSSNEFDVGAALQGPLVNHFRRPVTLIAFTSDSLLGVASMDDIRLNQINIPRPQPGDTITAAYADTSSPNAERTLRTGEVFLDRYLNNEGIGRTTIEATAFAWQSYFLDNHIVGLFGIRKDDTESFARANVDEVGFEDRIDGRWNPDFTRFSSAPRLVESGETTSWSLVGRYPEKWLGRSIPMEMVSGTHWR